MNFATSIFVYESIFQHPLMMKAIFSVFLFVFLFFGCINTNSTQEPYAYFGGEIINPNNDYITLRASTQEIPDTIFFNADNRFHHKVENLKSGIYFFMHGGEYQMIVLEPKDSIMVRLNTFDFDESLVYTGIGAKRNNWLIQSFLENVKKVRKLSDYFKMEPEAFHDFMEAERISEHIKLNNFLENSIESEAFINLAKAQIDYGNFAIKEIYPFGYFGNNRIAQIKELPEKFYEYRGNVDFNAEQLSEVYAYNRFLFSFFDNIAIEEYYKHHECHNPFDRQSLLHNLSKLKLIDSIVDNPKIKNHLFKFTARNFINNSNNQKEINTLLTDFVNRSTDEVSNKEIVELTESLAKMQPGQKLSNAELIDIQDNFSSIKSLVNKPTVIYFLSTNFKRHYQNSHKRAFSLNKAYPNVNFIAINLNNDNRRYWKKTLENSEFNLANEFVFKDLEQARKTFGINSINKVILIDKDLIIIHPNLNIFGSEIETYLANLE